MTQTYEISDFDTHTPFKCMIHHIGHVRAHMHDFFEILFILSGSCSLVVEDQLYQLGSEDLMIVESHTLHELRASDCVYASVQLDQTTLEQNFPVPMHPSFSCCSKTPGKEEAFAEMRRLIARLIQNNADRRSGYELRNWILVYQLMDVLFTHFRVAHTEAVDRRSHRYAARIAEISHIVKEHFREELPLSRVADLVHLSSPYLSKFFMEQFGMNYLAYLTQMRLNYAVHELVNTEKTIEEIAADSGFPNSHAFTQAFRKEYELMPSVYRRRQRSERKTEVPPAIEYRDYLAGLGKYLKDEKTAAPALPAITAHGECSAIQVQKPLVHTWRSVISVGKASDLLLAEIQTLLRRVKKELCPRYVFFNGILSDDLHVYSTDSTGQMVCNFAYIDRILDFLDEIGLLPFLQFSYMPSALAKNPDRILFGHLISEPKNLSAWCGLLRAFMEHVLRRYGLDTVSQWKFSVWHQPNTSSKLYGFEQDLDFYRFYQASREVVKSFDANLIFGLPSMYGNVAEEYSGWYWDFLLWCQKNACMPDFLNFTYYDIRMTRQKNHSKSAFGFVFMMTLNQETNGTKTFISSIKRELRDLGLTSLPVYISEWNSTPSQQDLLNDTCFKSCYIVKNILENYDRTASISYWSLSDLMSEAPLPDQFLFGGLGLFSADGLPKASYYALTLLSSLGGQFLASGDGWFATRTDSDIRIIAYYYLHFSHLYAIGEKFVMTPENRYTMFSSAPPLHLTLTLNDMENRTYTVKEYTVGRNAGSLYDAWARTGFTDSRMPADREILRAASAPGLRQSKWTVTEQKLPITLALEPLDVKLLILR